MRYTRQRRTYDCGPVAILNAMKWAGKSVNYQEYIPYLEMACRTVDPEDFDHSGTYGHDFDRVLRWAGKGLYRVRRSGRPSLKSIRRHLEQGGAVALAYAVPGGELHYTLFVGFDRGLFVVVNDDNDSTVNRRREATVASWMRRVADCPMAWYLARV